MCLLALTPYNKIMYRILIVDDDTFTLDMYTVKFSEAGNKVDSAENAEEALLKMRDGKEYDVILLDVIMPNVTGIDLIEKVKEEKLGGNPVCIVLSNHVEKDDVDRAMKAGAAGYIVKAHHVPSVVVERVGNLLEESRSKK